MKIYRDLTQGSVEWLAIRKGRPTASRFSDIVTATGKPSASAGPYIRELIAECFCPDFPTWGGNAATDRGVELEPAAREAFGLHTGLAIEQVGFVISDDNTCGCSPDSLVVSTLGTTHSAGVEIKCPAPKTHVGYVLDGVLPDVYRAQVHGSMIVTGFNIWHFYSHFPGLKPLHVVVQRDDYTELLAKALTAFVARYKEEMAAAVPKLQLPKI